MGYKVLAPCRVRTTSGESFQLTPGRSVPKLVEPTSLEKVIAAGAVEHTKIKVGGEASDDTAIGGDE